MASWWESRCSPMPCARNCFNYLRARVPDSPRCESSHQVAVALGALSTGKKSANPCLNSWKSVQPCGIGTNVAPP
jgi:hypothetical protein